MNKDVGGSGSFSSGQVPVIGGVKILMSNHLPSDNSSSTAGNNPNPVPLTAANGGSGRNLAYNGNFSKLRGLIFAEDAAATVKLLDLGVESEYQIERQGTLMVAKYACGHNILRPACAISLNSNV